MKYLGIDYGTKRIGIATSDDAGEMAFPYSVVLNNGAEKSAKEIAEICEKEKIGAVVIGDSLNYQMRENPLMSKVKKFEKFLTEISGLPAYYENETLTSAEAERIQGKNEMHDASAAAIILNSFLVKM